MQARSVVGGMILILTILVAPLPSSAAARTTSPRSEASSAQGADVRNVEEAARFRSEFGFPSDDATISALMAAGSTDFSFGAPLSPSELADMADRLALRELAEPVLAYVASRPDDFGGVYFTQDTGAIVLHLQPVAGAPAKVLAKARAMVPARLKATTEPVSFSMTELIAAEKDLVARRAQLGINELALDVKDNAIEVVLDPLVAQAGKTSQAGLTSQAGVPMKVSVGPPPRTAACIVDSCSPYRGGITVVGSTHNQLCTWGFYASRGSAAKYLITAGHCAGVGETEKHAGTVITDGIDKNTFQMVDKFQLSDSATAHVKGSSKAVAPFNTIRASGTDTAHTITAQRSSGSQVVGDAVCFEGVVTNTSLCGVIEATGLNYDLTREFDGLRINLSGQIRMSRNGRLGDSGGPVYQSHTAYGVLSALAGGTGHVLYGTIENVEADMGNTIICRSAAC